MFFRSGVQAVRDGSGQVFPVGFLHRFPKWPLVTGFTDATEGRQFGVARSFWKTFRPAREQIVAPRVSNKPIIAVTPTTDADAGLEGGLHGPIAISWLLIDMVGVRHVRFALCCLPDFLFDAEIPFVDRISGRESLVNEFVKMRLFCEQRSLNEEIHRQRPLVLQRLLNDGKKLAR